jgi:hypothetical protein
VDELLAAHDDARLLDFLQGASRATASAASGPGATVVSITEKPGDRIGRYKLLQKLGEGGCGVVCVAEQEEPVRRRVTLKVIKLEMDSKSVVARFEAERQALALMDHPNIAKVFDAGATDTGRPYFVMELWQPCLQVIAIKAGHALHILDRFRITSHLDQAVDQVRRAECSRLRGRPQAAKLEHMRWKLLRRGSRVRGHAKRKLYGLLHTKLATARAWMLKETFQDFWRCRSLTWAAAFLEVWWKDGGFGGRTAVCPARPATP